MSETVGRTPSRVESEVARARALAERGDFAACLASAESLLTEVPENRDVLYLVAVSQRYLGRVADALRTLAQLENLHPSYGRLFQERGHCLRSVGEAAAAARAYEHAVSLNSTLAASWNALSELYAECGDEAAAKLAKENAAKLAKLPAAVVAATNMFSEGDPYGAERVVRQFLRSHGDHIEAMRLLAQIGMKLEILDDADFLLESVLTFAPDYHAARFDYAQVLIQRQKFTQALGEVGKLVAIDHENRAYCTLEANALVGLGRHEQALKIYRDLVRESPNDSELHLSVAHSLKTMGRPQEAIEAYRRAAQVRPNYGDAYWSLANLKTYRFTDEEIARMRAQQQSDSLSSVDRFHLSFALGKALEDRGEYAESFAMYARGNEIKRREAVYDSNELERTLLAQEEVCTREFFAARRGWGCAAGDPIFIVGLPRAGSTLIEQILASHSLIEGTMELADIPRLVLRLNGREERAGLKYPKVLLELERADAQRLGENYLSDTRAYRQQAAAKPYFIDKLPNNFRHIGLIHLLLPNAKIIDARREPMACCFSNFKQLFASGQEFTYSLEDIARYYRAYIRVMAHWNRVLPEKVLRVQHEDLVTNLEANVRRLLDFLGLEFEPRCLAFHENERSVRTASSEQVRRPIYREGLDQWRHYQPYLSELEAFLTN